MSAVARSGAEIVFEGPVYSEILSSNRMVRIALPASYREDSRRFYPVLYIHDGQNAFSSAGPHAAFGWGNWELDKTAERLAVEGKMQELILVAIDCNPSRYREYRGPIATGDNKAYERYRDFLVKELKPRIDREYRTLTNAANTGVLGSSMGGLCSLALAWEHPEVFGNVASISGAFQVEGRFFLRQVLTGSKASKKPLRIYLDSGISDYSGGDDGAKDTSTVALQLRKLGWKIDQDLLHFVDEPLSAEELKPFSLPTDKFAEAQRSQHNELYWRLRAWRALTFLFPPNDK